MDAPRCVLCCVNGPPGCITVSGLQRANIQFIIKEWMVSMPNSEVPLSTSHENTAVIVGCWFYFLAAWSPELYVTDDGVGTAQPKQANTGT